MVLVEIMKIIDNDCKCRVYQDEELVFDGFLDQIPCEYLYETVSKICPQTFNRLWIFLD